MPEKYNKLEKAKITWVEAPKFVIGTNEYQNKKHTKYLK